MPHRYVTMTGLNPTFTVEKTIFDCGVMDVALFNGNRKADRMATELFDDDFSFCMDKTYEEFDENLKSYSNLTVFNGKLV